MGRGSSKPRAKLPVAKAAASTPKVKAADYLADGRVFITPDGERVVASDRRVYVSAGSAPWGLSSSKGPNNYRRVYNDGKVEVPAANAWETWTVVGLQEVPAVELREGGRYLLPDDTEVRAQHFPELLFESARHERGFPIPDVFVLWPAYESRFDASVVDALRTGTKLYAVFHSHEPWGERPKIADLGLTNDASAYPSSTAAEFYVEFLRDAAPTKKKAVKRRG